MSLFLSAAWAIAKKVPLWIYALGLLSGLWLHSAHDYHSLVAKDKTEANTRAELVIRQKADALAKEQVWTAKLESTQHEYQVALETVARERDAAIAGLRDRPVARRPVPSAASAASAGATGAELARPDAEFLARYAAVARKFQLELGACQAREAVIGGK